MATRKSWWSKPLNIDTLIKVQLLAECIANECPRGAHTHDDKEIGYGAYSGSGNRSRRMIKGKVTGGWPRSGGRLSNYFRHIPNWHLADRGKRAYINVMLAYARIIVLGGTVADVIGWASGRRDKQGRKWSKVAGSWRMHWAGPTFRASRKGYTIHANNFIERGIEKFMNYRGGIKVSWSKGTNTA